MDFSKQIDISPISKYSCFQEALKNVCDKFNKDFQCFFAREWGMVFEENINIDIAMRINVPFLDKMNIFMENYMGFKVNFYNNADNLSIVMKEAIQNGAALLVGMDAYGCNWNPAYKRTHVPHFFIIDSMIAEDNILLCCDTYYSKQVYSIELHNIIKYFRNLRVIYNSSHVLDLNIEDIKHIFA